MSEFREWTSVVIGVIGGVIGFSFGNISEIRNYISPSYLSVGINETDFDLSAVVKSFPEGEFEISSDGLSSVPAVQVDPGAYSVEFILDEESIQTNYISITRGTDYEIDFPSAQELSGVLGRTIFDVRGMKDKYSPGEFIPLDIFSLSTGYVWVFESFNGGDMTRIFPPTSSNFDNMIVAGEKMDFSNRDSDGFSADVEVGNYELLFVLTSTNDVSLANQIASNLTGKIVKAFGNIDESWGFFSADYTVEQL